ncbi:MAG: phage tail tape measure protein, partial [Methanosarcina mazei]
MARGSIRGITIEIGGNTQKLQDALKQVNAKSRDLQSELREVDRLLKLDPKNTELLTQKQKLLTEAVSGTKEKLDTLKEAERQVKEQFAQGKVGEEQYRAIQGEVVKTQQELKQLEKDLNEVNSKWKAAADGLSDFGKKSEDMGKKLLPVSAVITGAGVASTKLASDFSDAMAKASTIADTTSVPLETLRKEILELS